MPPPLSGWGSPERWSQTADAAGEELVRGGVAHNRAMRECGFVRIIESFRNMQQLIFGESWCLMKNAGRPRVSSTFGHISRSYCFNIAEATGYSNMLRDAGSMLFRFPRLPVQRHCSGEHTLVYCITFLVLWGDVPFFIGCCRAALLILLITVR